jgi:muramoyltetrapeptide carboxypeptidase
VDGFLAGSDDRRADELNGYLRDPDVRGIFMGRGGYGLMRILDQLDDGALRADPKPLIGFSDGTALLAWALTSAGVRGVHGPVLTQLGELGDRDVSALFDLLESVDAPPPITDLMGTVDADPIEGALVGGNLCMVANLAGTHYQIDTRDALVFLEDVGERPYAIDRYMTRLHLTGALDGALGLVFGDFTSCEPEPHRPPEQRTTALEVLTERAAAFELPAVRGLPVGHGAHNRALPFGGKCRLDVRAGRLELLESAVA